MDEEARGAATDAGPVKIFMSYRRADDRHFIGRLRDRLCDAFGDEVVFRDIDSIPAGTNFRKIILRTLHEVDAVVAVIGPNCARSATTPDLARHRLRLLGACRGVEAGQASASRPHRRHRDAVAGRTAGSSCTEITLTVASETCAPSPHSVLRGTTGSRHSS